MLAWCDAPAVVPVTVVDAPAAPRVIAVALAQASLAGTATQRPAVHDCPVAQARPQAPQSPSSSCVDTQGPRQSVSPVAQAAPKRRFTVHAPAAVVPLPST